MFLEFLSKNIKNTVIIRCFFQNFIQFIFGIRFLLFFKIKKSNRKKKIRFLRAIPKNAENLRES